MSYGVILVDDWPATVPAYQVAIFICPFQSQSCVQSDPCLRLVKIIECVLYHSFCSIFLSCSSSSFSRILIICPPHILDGLYDDEALALLISADLSSITRTCLPFFSADLNGSYCFLYRFHPEYDTPSVSAICASVIV